MLSELITWGGVAAVLLLGWVLYSLVPPDIEAPFKSDSRDDSIAEGES